MTEQLLKYLWAMDQVHSVLIPENKDIIECRKNLHLSVILTLIAISGTLEVI